MAKKTTMTVGEHELVHVILGAGRPHSGHKHAALQSTNNETKVLDWSLAATAKCRAEVRFVGGYQIDRIERAYPDFRYLVNDEWESTLSAYSMLLAVEDDHRDHLFSYADILFRENLVEALNQCEADIVVAIDTQWKVRYENRPLKDVERAEKVVLHKDQVTRLGADLVHEEADAEFIGCVRIGGEALSYLLRNREALLEKCRKIHLVQLIEILRQRGFGVRFVDVHGDWAEINKPQDLPHFVLGTKAQTLHRLQGVLKLSSIADQVSFTVGRWLEDQAGIIGEIADKFGSQRIVARSSALAEDGFLSSAAGAYTSVLNIDQINHKAVVDAIETVAGSYPDKNPKNQILVQPMLESVSASGVVFTRNLSNGTPYYVINMDDVSGSTDSVTSGRSSDLRTFYVHRMCSEKELARLPGSVSQVIAAAREVESVLGYTSLDIEFAITAQGVYVLQARPIAVEHGEVDDERIAEITLQVQEQFLQSQKKPLGIVGDKALFGIMPDWNPAEIIGTNPGPLAFSLYRYLITDDIWARQRAEYGYRDVRPRPLMIAFCGHPYIDVRASMNSFLPAGLDDATCEALVNFYAKTLEDNPHLHDKLEFDVLPTCYSLNFVDWKDRLVGNGVISRAQFDVLERGMFELTQRALTRCRSDLDKVAQLSSRIEAVRRSSLPSLEKICIYLDDCREYGTLPFAHLARSGFVAVTLLRSAVATGVMTTAEMEKFMQSVRTVSHRLVEDAMATKSGAMHWDEFVDRYGHLRPGTYDITSRSYFEDPEVYLRPAVDSAHQGSHTHQYADDAIVPASIEKLAQSMRDHGFSCSGEELHRFLKDAIEGREYAKFVFSRGLSFALDEIVKWGTTHKMSRADIAAIDLSDIFLLRAGGAPVRNVSRWLARRAARNKRAFSRAQLVELPPLICSATDMAAFELPVAQFNFVGSSSIIADAIVLEADSKADDLSGKIVLIPQADPGFDWIFGCSIAGLITMHGGSNSHMAIRAAEFGMPAAIGVGPAEYERLSHAAKLEIDPANRLIRIIL